MAVGVSVGRTVAVSVGRAVAVGSGVSVAVAVGVSKAVGVGLAVEVVAVTVGAGGEDASVVVAVTRASAVGVADGFCISSRPGWAVGVGVIVLGTIASGAWQPAKAMSKAKTMAGKRVLTMRGESMVLVLPARLPSITRPPSMCVISPVMNEAALLARNTISLAALLLPELIDVRL